MLLPSNDRDQGATSSESELAYTVRAYKIVPKVHSLVKTLISYASLFYTCAADSACMYSCDAVRRPEVASPPVRGKAKMVCFAWNQGKRSFPYHHCRSGVQTRTGCAGKDLIHKATSLKAVTPKVRRQLVQWGASMMNPFPPSMDLHPILCSCTCTCTLYCDHVFSEFPSCRVVLPVPIRSAGQEFFALITRQSMRSDESIQGILLKARGYIDDGIW